MTKELLQKTADEYREAYAKALHCQKVLFEHGFRILLEEDLESPFACSKKLIEVPDVQKLIAIRFVEEKL